MVVVVMAEIYIIYYKDHVTFGNIFLLPGCAVTFIYLLNLQNEKIYFRNDYVVKGNK